MLKPVVVQEAHTKEVFTLAYANEEALRLTKETGFAHFYSRSRQKIWKKGEESSNTMRVVQILEDCDEDALLYLVDFPMDKKACHTGNRSCFFKPVYGETVESGMQFLEILYKIVEDRKVHPSENSYTSKLFEEGLNEILKKFGEEAVEVVVAGHQAKDRLVHELADLIYHLTVLLVAKELSWSDVTGELNKRSSKNQRAEPSWKIFDIIEIGFYFCCL